ncbi:HDOD domain-containing protein [Alteromonas facilis]|uniref:HDOD domain-containing protein n=1 Tax=Alteromonas facilis TaxID=2048004 RepID=UPI000C2943BE|nr:HDOD domain-containing protein [Alteromonas facilis]
MELEVKQRVLNLITEVMQANGISSTPKSLKLDESTCQVLFNAGHQIAAESLGLYASTLAASVTVGSWLDILVMMLEEISDNQSLFVLTTSVSGVTITISEQSEVLAAQCVLCGVLVQQLRLSGLLNEGWGECQVNTLFSPWQGNTFDSNNNLLCRLKISQEHLSRPMRNANERVYQTLERQLNIYRRGHKNQANIEFAVVREVMRTQEWSELSQSSVAAKLAMSERTLSRKLQNEDLKFRDIVSAARNAQALSLLFTGHSISDVTDKLGFSDRATFERSFKKWQGMSPAKIQAQYVLLAVERDVHDIVDAEQLPHLPATVSKLLDCLKDSESTIEQIIELLQNDPVLVAKIMKIANSSMYSHVKVANLKQAVIAIFGVEKLYALTLAIVSAKTFSGISSKFNYASFWHNALLTAHVIELLGEAKGLAKDIIEDSYLAALLHNIGEMVLYFCLPAKMVECTEQLDEYPTWREKNRYQHYVVGTSTVSVSAFVCRLWHMPEHVCRLIESLSPVKDAKTSIVDDALDLVDYLLQPTKQTQHQAKHLLAHYFAYQENQREFLTRCKQMRDELDEIAKQLVTE